MNLFHLLLSAAVVSTASAQQCEAPSQGCTYGMFNYEKCLCECIKPFCRDANGDCVVPLDNCGGNPWEDCVRGVNCPWWGSLSSGDVCNTGSQVPAGVWEIFNTREICCGKHAPFSTVCKTKGPNGAVFDPNKDPNSPAMAPIVQEVILKFVLDGLPTDADITRVKETSQSGLETILLQLMERTPDLQVDQISERVCSGRRLDEHRQIRMTERELRDTSICYVVDVIDSGKGQDYEKILVSETKSSADVVLDEIRTKLNYQNVGINLDEIGSENVKSGSGGSSVSGGSSGGGTGGSFGGSNPATMSNGVPESSFPGWAIALIVVLLLMLSCCIGYCILASARNGRGEKGDVNVLFNLPDDNNSRRGNPSRSQNGSTRPPRRQRSFAQRGTQAIRQSFARRNHRSGNPRDSRRRRDDESSRRRDDRSRRHDDGSRRRRSRYENFRSSFTGMSSRVHRPRPSRGDRSMRGDTDGPSITLAYPQDPKFGKDDFTVNTYTTNKIIPQDPPLNALVLYDPAYAKPDPEGETASNLPLLTNGEELRNFSQQPDTKPQLEPEEIHTATATVAVPRQVLPDPSVAAFAEPQPVLYGKSGDDSSDDEDEYDSYGFRKSSRIYAPQRQNKHPDELEDSMSFATEDPDEPKRRVRKSRKKKKTKRRAHSSESRKRLEESDYSLDIEQSARSKAYSKRDSGVESVASGGDDSYDLDSRASA
mmetsp:Transcript_17330/g.27165  ORF Transcript_17330/g.27165 Transcript_17330/m.27165 type:complete len:709 (+) Transcript_17330:76-2202(+)